MNETFEKDKDPMPEEFARWWYPTGVDQRTGVSVGGHPDASRIWARTDDGGKSYARERYGITARLAWICQEYRDAYNEWISIGAPPPSEPYASYSLPMVEQKKRWAEIMDMLKGVGMIPKESQVERQEEIPL